MSHNASDVQKLLSVVTVTAVYTDPANPFLVTKGLTASSPATGGVRHFQLPDPTTIPAGMSYEIKDSNGTAGAAGNKIVVMAPGSVQIDGSTDDDEITKAWGSKVFVSLGNHYLVRGDQRAVLGTPSGGGAYSNSFPGTEEQALPSGWSASRVDGPSDSWPADSSGWLVQDGTFFSGGPAGDTTSLGDHYDGSGTYVLPRGGSTTLTYAAGTLSSADVVVFSWMLDVVYSGWHNYVFQVNGVTVNTFADGDNGTWQAISYTVPSTGTYEFKWLWALDDSSNAKYANATLNNGCFLDEFKILDALSPTAAYNFDGVEEAPLPTGWSASRTGAWPADSSGWLHQEGIFYPASTSTSSLGDHFDGTGDLLPVGESSTLTYNAGTLTAGQVVEFQWMRSLREQDRHTLHFEVNGSSVSSVSGWSPGRGVWDPITYAIPTTGTYTLSWRWQLSTHYESTWTSTSYLNGCFIDEFKIMPVP